MYQKQKKYIPCTAVNRKLKDGTKRKHRSRERAYIVKAIREGEESTRPIPAYRKADDLWNYD